MSALLQIFKPQLGKNFVKIQAEERFLIKKNSMLALKIRKIKGFKVYYKRKKCLNSYSSQTLFYCFQYNCKLLSQ